MRSIKNSEFLLQLQLSFKKYTVEFDVVFHSISCLFIFMTQKIICIYIKPFIKQNDINVSLMKLLIGIKIILWWIFHPKYYHEIYFVSDYDFISCCSIPRRRFTQRYYPSWSSLFIRLREVIPNDIFSQYLQTDWREIIEKQLSKR